VGVVVDSKGSPRIVLAVSLIPANTSTHHQKNERNLNELSAMKIGNLNLEIHTPGLIPSNNNKQTTTIDQN